MQEPTAPRAEATVTTARRQVSHVMASGSSVPRAPSPPSALLPHDLFTARWTYPFGLDNTAMSLARTICPGAGTCVERPLVLLHDTEMRQQAQQVVERLGFPQIRRPRHLGPRRYTLTTLRQQLAEEGHRCFYTAEPDPDSKSDSYDPTRECFNIDGAVATTEDTEDAAASARAPTAGEDPKTPGNDGKRTHHLRTTRPRNLRSYES